MANELDTVAIPYQSHQGKLELQYNISGANSIPDICHGLTDGVRGEKICHVEKFQISVHDRCEEM